MDGAIISGIMEKMEKMQKKIDQLETKRINQMDILPDVVKTRHIGEGVRFIRDGETADKPVRGEEPLQGAASFFDRTANKLWLWNRDSGTWKYVTLS